MLDIFNDGGQVKVNCLLQKPTHDLLRVYFDNSRFYKMKPAADVLLPCTPTDEDKFYFSIRP